VVPHLVLPADRIERFLANLERHDRPLSTWAVYRLRPGDRVDRIAAAHGISAQALRLVNSLPRRVVLHPGDTLLVPMRDEASSEDSVPAALQRLLSAAERDPSSAARGAVIAPEMALFRRSI